jgi:type I restriction enzyme S subunit
MANLIETETGKRAKGGALSKGTVASIGGEHVGTQGKIIWDNMKFIPEDFYEFLSQGKVQKGDVLLVKDGATTGKVAIVDHLVYEKVAVNEHVFLIRPKTDQLLNQFVFYFLWSKLGQTQIKTKFHGLIGGIIRNDLGTILMPFPSEIEQRGIVDVLDTVDSTIELSDRVIAKTERLKKGLMQQLLTHGLEDTESKNSPIGKIPQSWEVTTINKECSVGTGGTPSRNTPSYFGGNIPWVKSTEVDYGVIVKTEEKLTEQGVQNSNAKLFPAGSLVMALYGQGRTRGKCAILGIDASVNQACAVIQSKGRIHIPYMLYWCQNSYSAIRGLSQGANQANLNMDIIRSLDIPLPSMSEQKKIAEILLTVDANLKIEKEERTKFERIKRGLMDLLLTGKVGIKVD